MLKHILFTACILLLNSRASAWFDHDVLYQISRECIRQYNYSDAGTCIFLLSEQQNSLPPREQMRFGSSGLEWAIPTHNWKPALKILDQSVEVVRDYPLRSKNDSLQLGIFLYRVGELAAEYGVPSRERKIREKGIKILSKALAYIPQDDPHFIYALVQSGLLKRLIRDKAGASTDLNRARKLAGSEISKASMRAHQSLGIYYHEKARKNYGDWTQARFHIDSARAIAVLIDDAEPKDLFIQSYYFGDLQSYYYENPMGQPVANSPSIAKEILLEADSVSRSFNYPDHYLYLCETILGNLFYDEGQYLKAIEFDVKAYESMDPACYLPEKTAEKLNQIGTGYQRLGEFGISLVYQTNALDMLNKTKQESSRSYLSSYAMVNNNLATSMPDSVTLQIQYLEEALHALKKIEAPELIDLYNIAQIQANLGLMLGLSDDTWEESSAMFHGAIQSYEKILPNAPEIATCYAALALKLVEKDRQAAARYIDLAATFPFDPDAEVVQVAEALIGTGDAYQQLGDYGLSLDFYRKGLWALAIDSIASLPGYPEGNKIIERNIGLLAFQGIGNSLLKMGTERDSPELYQESYGAFKDAIEMSHILRQQQTEQISQVNLVNRTRNLYESAIWLALKLNQIYPEKDYFPEALDLAEQSRGLVLLAAVSSQDAAASAGVPDSIILRQRELQINYDGLQRQRSTATDEDDIKEINAGMLAITAEQNAITHNLKVNYRNYYEQVYETETTPYEVIQQDLAQRNAGMVEYFFGDSILFTFALTADTFVVQQERISPEFEAQLDHIQEAQVSSHLENWGDQYWKDAYAVYNFLLADLGVDLPANLLIIPDGRLNYLSFDALVVSPFSEDFANAGYHEIPYLVFNKVISYDYSYTIRNRRQPYQLNEPVSLLAMAPSFDSTPLPNLPKSEENIKKLGQEYDHVSTLIGEEANLFAFREEAPKHTIVDLATHGKMDPVNSADCRLYFCPDSSDSGLLHLGEIYNMDLDIRMAVLEACESGLGPDARGEGVMSLARGFSYAGCRTIVTSLWNVAEEDITVDIFKQFYHHLSEGVPVDSALTLAKRDYLLAYRESPGQKGAFFKPFYWSEMVVIGDTAPIPIEKYSRYQANSGLFAGLVLILLTIILLGVRWRLRRKNISE